MTEKQKRNKYKAKKQNAKQRKIEFSLSFEQFCKLLSEENCFYTGEKLIKTLVNKKQEPNSFTIDRVNNLIGYVEGNCVACTYAVNLFKSRIEIQKEVIEHPYYEKVKEGIKRFEKLDSKKESKFKRILKIILE